MRKLLLALLLAFGFLQQGNAQKFDYDHSSNFFIGLNIGYVWHTSDVKNVKNRFPIGGGFTFGGTFNRDYGKFFTYDLQLRFLMGSWYGQDRDTTHAIKDNYAVSSLYDTLGYTVQNFRAKQRSIDLEFAVHFNRVKERTGIDPYIFGGVGFTFTNTKGDLLKKNNGFDSSIYPYNENPSGELIAKEYNTPLDKNNTGVLYDGFDVNFLPSLGVGIGYYFNSNFSIGLEHKTTFFNGDYFDGTPLNQDGESSKIKNDLFHYTSIYFKWYLNKGKNKREDKQEQTEEAQVPPRTPITQEPDGNQEPEVQPQPTRKRPPIVEFTNPSKSPLKTNQSTVSIIAKTAYVKSASNITFTINGREHNTFIFNPKDEVFKSNVQLNVGRNTFKIVGVNADGSDSDVTVVIYERNRPQDAYPPTVNIVDPGNTPYNVNQLNYVVKAAIHNVKARNQVKVTFNGQPFTAFSFNPNGNINFSANLNLKSGVNTLNIIGQNTAGTDQDETVLIYTRSSVESAGNPPTVKLIVPNTNPFTTSKTSVDVTAKIEHVQNNQQIEVIINGVSTTNFSYNSETQLAKFKVSVSSGYNNIRVKAKNPYGTDKDEMQIIYKRGYNPEGNNLPPLVSITSPNVNPYTSTKQSITVRAKAEQVKSKQDIEVKVNGVKTNNFIFNATFGAIQMDVNLTEGSNIINIKASNNFGNDSDVTQIIYRKRTPKVNPPKINIITPNKDPYTTTHLSEKVIAKVENISQKNQITVVINGKGISNFSYNSSSQQVRVNAALVLGSNTIKMTAKNTSGQATDKTEILREKIVEQVANETVEPLPCIPPKIQFLTPNKKAETTKNKTFKVTAKLINIKSKSQITVLFNNRKTTNFSYDSKTGVLKQILNLQEGKSTYMIRLRNACGFKQETVTLSYEAPSCGVDITIFNTDFCLAKPGGMVERNELLTNNQFQYNGTAKTIYFKAKNNGLAKVNGVDYPLVKGNYYYFMGLLTVDIKKINNEWHVCVESARKPQFGKGSSKPEYTCGESIGSGSKNETIETKPKINKEDIQTKPKPAKTMPTKTKTPREVGNEEPKTDKPSKPAKRTDKRSRQPKGGG